MKPFDLEKALAGEPVVLRNGIKAYVLCDIRDLFPKSRRDLRCLIGVQAIEGNNRELGLISRWKVDGKYYERLKESEYDIVGMFEEPKLTTQEIMEKAFREELILKHSLLPNECKGFKVVGKTVNGEYILQDCDDNEMYFSHIFNENIEWIIKD